LEQPSVVGKVATTPASARWVVTRGRLLHGSHVFVFILQFK